METMPGGTCVGQHAVVAGRSSAGSSIFSYTKPLTAGAGAETLASRDCSKPVGCSSGGRYPCFSVQRRGSNFAILGLHEWVRTGTSRGAVARRNIARPMAMAHTATSTVGKDAGSAKSKNIFLFYGPAHPEPQALRARHAHQMRESADLRPDKARGNVPNVRPHRSRKEPAMA